VIWLRPYRCTAAIILFMFGSRPEQRRDRGAIDSDAAGVRSTCAEWGGPGSGPRGNRHAIVVTRTKAAPSPRPRPSPARLWPRVARFEALVKVARHRGHQRANLAVEEVIRGLHDARIDHDSLLSF
jgi:hypothetical protein